MNVSPCVSRVRLRFWLELASVSGFFAVIPLARAETPVLTIPDPPDGVVGQQFVFQITATNHPTSYTASGLPAGLSLVDNKLGIISGIPTDETTNKPVTLTATNESNEEGTKDVTFTVLAAPSPSPVPLIISSTCSARRTGEPFSFQVLTTNPNQSTDLSVTLLNELPDGLTFDPATNVISGTPTTDGSSVVTLSVSDGLATTNNFLQLTFISDLTAPMITSGESGTLVPGQFFSYTITTDQPDSATFFGYIGLDGMLNGCLPSGLSFDPDTATISGTYTPEIINECPLVRGSDATPDTIKKDQPPHIQLLVAEFPPIGSLASAFEPGSPLTDGIFGTGTAPLNFFTAGEAQNISTRGNVQMGDSALIGGFIITGTSTKKVILRAIGPSLIAFGVLDALADPIIELHKPDGTIMTNDNWREIQEQEITDTGLQPSNDLESAIVATLDPVDPMVSGTGQYTAIVRGADDGTGGAFTGVALVEVYDLDSAADSQLANISTRGFVGTDEDVMIGGFIIGGGGGGDSTVVVRAIGPSLADFGIANPLQDPTLELVGSNGATIAFDDNWKDSQQAEIEAEQLAPADDLESAIEAVLTPGAYTAIVRGVNDNVGVGLVEVYRIR
jgi:Putative Ig domain